MSRPVVVGVEAGSAAEAAGLRPGDEVRSIDGSVPTDVIAWQLLLDEADPELELLRDGRRLTVTLDKPAGIPLGAEVNAAIFDRVQTCDNHCEFCFIYQLPPGLRRSLYLKDDDYRLSFLYGNFTTLTRFTEYDLERVLDERLSPLYVSIHATDPDVRARMLRNRRGAVSLRWLEKLLAAGIEVHGQVVVCPGVNDGAVLADTMIGVLDRYPELETLAVVPLGVSAHQREAAMRPHTAAEAAEVIDLCEQWQERFSAVLGRRLVFASDEFYLVAGRDFPEAGTYGDFPMHEDGIGMVRAFEQEFEAGGDAADGSGDAASVTTRAPAAGFFSWVDGAPAEGYRAVRAPGGGANRGGQFDLSQDSGTIVSPVAVSIGPRSNRGTDGTGLKIQQETSAEESDKSAEPRPIALLTGTYGAQVLEPLVARWQSHTDEHGGGDRSGTRPDVRVLEVPNRFFGGNIGVAGLLAGTDISDVLADEPTGCRYLLADVCLSGGKFLDGMTPDELSRPVEIVPTNGGALRRLLDDAFAGAPEREPTRP